MYDKRFVMKERWDRKSTTVEIFKNKYDAWIWLQEFEEIRPKDCS